LRSGCLAPPHHFGSMMLDLGNWNALQGITLSSYLN
jgi:hypothetical protein